MDAGLETIGRWFCFFTAFALAGVSIGGVVLRGTCALSNKVVRTESQAPMPTLTEAMAIIGIAYVVQIALGLLLGVVIGGAAAGAGISLQGAQTLILIVGIPYTLMVHTLVLEGMLPTTFGRALLMTVLQLAVAYGLLGGLVALIFLVAG